MSKEWGKTVKYRDTYASDRQSHVIFAQLLSPYDEAGLCELSVFHKIGAELLQRRARLIIWRQPMSTKHSLDRVSYRMHTFHSKPHASYRRRQSTSTLHDLKTEISHIHQSSLILNHLLQPSSTSCQGQDSQLAVPQLVDLASWARCPRPGCNVRSCS